MAPAEIFRVTPAEFPQWKGDGTAEGTGAGAAWVMRVFNNLFPRVPAELTAGRNESYIVVEDPRHFSSLHPRAAGDLMCTGALGEEHFLRLILTDVAVMRRATENRAVRSIVIRKNQGRESGASQPHLHQQLIGAPSALPVLEAEAEARTARRRDCGTSCSNWSSGWASSSNGARAWSASRVPSARSRAATT